MGLRVICLESDAADGIAPRGEMVLRPRREGDRIRLSGGTKSLKKLFIDKKIPADRRGLIPVVADETGVLAVHGFGPNRDRIAASGTGIQVRFEEIEKGE